MGSFGEFIEHDGLAFEPVEGTDAIVLQGEIKCQGRIAISVFKILLIVGGSDRTALVQTVDYSYNVRVEGVGNVLRYDSAHPDHNCDHHVHHYDILNGDRQGRVTLHGEAGWPTLGEVIAEVRSWYWENHDAIAALGAGDAG